MKNRILKITLLSFLSVILLIVLCIGSYLVYVVCQYSRIEDNLVLEVMRNKDNKKIPIEENLTFTSYNIGFGAYSNDYTFFLDTGINPDGKSTVGKNGKAKSKEEVLKNTNGSIDLLKQLSSDFIAIQEVDVDSDRAFHVNQQEMINDEFLDYAETFAINFHSAFLAYPLYDMHGKTTAGLQTLSKYQIDESIRKSYIVTDDFIAKYMDLDRCFSINKIPTINDKYLVLINSHMSAYDEGGTIRNKQLEQLNQVMVNELEKGNYVIVGGDFNHDLVTNNPRFSYTKEKLPFSDQFVQLIPEWLSFLFDEEGNCKFDNRFQIIADDQVPTLRCADIPYQEGFSYVSSVDGFIISNNIEFVDISTLKASDEDTEMFAFSDHQPTTITFKLKG